MDKVEQFQNSTIHHGKYSDRLYVLKFPADGNNAMVNALVQKAIDNRYSKIIAKSPGKALPVFLECGFKIESTIPLFFKGEEDCFFVSKFLSDQRAVFDPEPMQQFIQVRDNYKIKTITNPKHSYKLGALHKDDAGDMVNIFKQVFTTYPFPIHDRKYIEQTMDNDVHYFGAFENGNLIGVSSAEIDFLGQNAEMTDFAVHPNYRGKGLSKILLNFMEVEMEKEEIKTIYTIARLHSIPMNKTFLSARYHFAGTLINNTNIAGGIESMNIFYKYI